MYIILYCKYKFKYMYYFLSDIYVQYNYIFNMCRYLKLNIYNMYNVYI